MASMLYFAMTFASSYSNSIFCMKISMEESQEQNKSYCIVFTLWKETPCFAHTLLVHTFRHSITWQVLVDKLQKINT